MKPNLPTALTWLRIVVIPLLLAVYSLPPEWLSLDGRNRVATALFVGAAVTDWLDGWLARKLHQTSAFGAFLDPVADKLLVASALIVLVDIERTSAWIAAVIIGREIAISALREWMAGLGRSRNVAVNLLGKVKTAAQMSAIPMLLFNDPLLGIPLQAAGSVLIVVAAILTLVSMGYYLRLALPQSITVDHDDGA
jgi:CDP-diacylglycerol--glycerol-3-phosphate 3-phosphatidyltransferase/cardiolipin synthase